MPKIENILKSEIIRLAKKEVKAASRPLASEVRAMKKKFSALSKKFSLLQRWGKDKMRQEEEKKAQLKVSTDEVKKSRFTPARIKNLRLKLGLSQRELGILTGATLGAVGGWESGRFVPRKDKKAAMLALKKLGKREVRKVLAKKEAEVGGEKPKRRKARKISKKKAGRGRKPGRPPKKKTGRPKKTGAKKKRAKRQKRK